MQHFFAFSRALGSREIQTIVPAGSLSNSVRVVLVLVYFIYTLKFHKISKYDAQINKEIGGAETLIGLRGLVLSG